MGRWARTAFFAGFSRAARKAASSIATRWSAFLTIGPINPGHVLVVPTRHAAGVADLSAEENAAIFFLARRLTAALRRPPISCEGVNYWLADGEAAFQDVFHAHLHVVPRFAGDSFRVSFDRSNPTRQELDRIATALAADAGSG